MKTAMVRARVDEQLNHGIPFEVKILNKTTLKTFADTDKKCNLVHSKNAKEMFDKLGI